MNPAQADLEDLACSAYPESFKLAEFKALKTPAKRIRYAAEHLDKVATGSARAVFVVDDSRVIKIARGPKGLAQNRVEADVSRMYDDCIARVLDSDDGDTWIESERAYKLPAQEFSKLVGCSFKEMDEMLRYEDSRRRPNRYPPAKPARYDELVENETVSQTIDMVVNFDMPVGDLTRPSSWGKVIRGGKHHAVVVDYGLTQDVYEEHYSKKPKKDPYGGHPLFAAGSDQYLLGQVLPRISDNQWSRCLELVGCSRTGDPTWDARQMTLECVVKKGREMFSLEVSGSYATAGDGEFKVRVSAVDGSSTAADHQLFTQDPTQDAVALMKMIVSLLKSA